MSSQLRAVVAEDHGDFEVLTIMLRDDLPPLCRIELAKPREPGFERYCRWIPGTDNFEVGWELPATPARTTLSVPPP